MGEDNRRRHQRLEIPEDAIAVDSQQRELGRVMQAGGGGCRIDANDDAVLQRLKVGTRVQITVLEPKSQTRNTIDVVVRYHTGRQIGLEFVTGNTA